MGGLFSCCSKNQKNEAAEAPHLDQPSPASATNTEDSDEDAIFDKVERGLDTKKHTRVFSDPAPTSKEFQTAKRRTSLGANPLNSLASKRN